MNLKSLAKNVVAIRFATNMAKKMGMSQKNAQQLATAVVPIVVGIIADKLAEANQAAPKNKKK